MSTTIKEAIQALKSRIADAYMAISAKGGTLPATQDSANLPTAISSIPSGGGKVYIDSSKTPSLFKSLQGIDDVGEQNIVLVGASASLSYMFQNSGVSKIDLSSWGAIKITSMFNFASYAQSCDSIKLSRNFDTSECTSWDDAFRVYAYTYGARYIDLADCVIRDDAYLAGGLFFWNTRLEQLTGLHNLYQGINLSQTALGHDAIVSILNEIPVLQVAKTITLGSSKLALLSNDEKAIATNKNWTLA